MYINLADERNAFQVASVVLVSQEMGFQLLSIDTTKLPVVNLELTKDDLFFRNDLTTEDIYALLQVILAGAVDYSAKKIFRYWFNAAEKRLFGYYMAKFYDFAPEDEVKFLLEAYVEEQTLFPRSDLDRLDMKEQELPPEELTEHLKKEVTKILTENMEEIQMLQKKFLKHPEKTFWDFDDLYRVEEA